EVIVSAAEAVGVILSFRMTRSPSVPFPGGKFRETFQYFVGQSAHIADFSSVHEQRRRSGDFERRAQGNGLLHPGGGFRLGGTGAVAAPLAPDCSARAVSFSSALLAVMSFCA